MLDHREGWGALDHREMRVGDIIVVNIVDSLSTPTIGCDGKVRHVKRSVLGHIESFWDYGQRVKVKVTIDDELMQVVVDKRSISVDNQIYIEETAVC